MEKKLRPIIKWTGGKFDEFSLFADYIPEFGRYVEPFFGGGGVFFALQPQVPSFINDKSTDLINFYNQIGKASFKLALFRYANAWDELAKLHHQLWDECATDFIGFIEKENHIQEFENKINSLLIKVLRSAEQFCETEFIIDFSLFEKIILASLLDKAKRIKRIHLKEKRNFSVAELKVHFETGLRSGSYLFFRKLLNQQHQQTITLSPAKAAANWYFVREFCYGAMFRFNTKGEFNIPYGGIAYNKKNFRQKITQIFNPKVTNLFKHTKVFNQDFEMFLNQVKLKKGDFIFLDPPYDSEFSEYDQSAFTKDDQRRLAAYLLKVPAKWMVVIKETEFIRELYTYPTIKIVTFDKSYTYNMRGRNNRAVTHLIIMNY